MPMIRAMRLLNAAEAGLLTSLQLQALLAADASRIGELNILFGLRGQARRISASATTVGVFAGSALAMGIIAASPVTMAALIASPAALAPLFASSTAVSAIVASPGALDTVMVPGAAFTTMLASGDAMDVVAASAPAMAKIAASNAMMDEAVSSSTAFSAMVAVAPAMTAIGTNASAIATIVASDTMMNAVVSSAPAINAFALSSIAMTAVWASDSATDLVLASSIGRLAVYNSDVALAALQFNSTQVQRKVTSGATMATTATVNVALVPNGTKIILLRRFYTGANDRDFLNWSRGSTTNGVGNGPTAGSGPRTLYQAASTAAGCAVNSYTASSYPSSNNSIANFVCAANGLRRDSWWASGITLTVYYIPV